MHTNKHLGKHMRHALAFATKHTGWHTFNARCTSTSNAIARLAKRDLVLVNSFNQFKLVQSNP